MTETAIAVKVENVSKSFRLPTESTQSLRTALVNRFKGIKGYKEQEVLRDINFEVYKGDFFGIVGRNGSGKSTLLKIISQIYVPEKGQVAIDGKLVSFIELGVGFNPELTGCENVYMNGAMLGFTTEEIDAMYDDIVEFAELRDFMNQKLKNYSSGMQVRLAFSVAIKAQGDILILDEVLAVGDEAFQRKCNDYFQERMTSGKTTILVTHDMGAVKKYCNRAVLIEDGLVKAYGDPFDVANQYSVGNVVQSDDFSERETLLTSLVTDFEVKMLSPTYLSPSQDIVIEFSYTVSEDIETHIALTFLDVDTNKGIYNDNSLDYQNHGKKHCKLVYTCRLDYLNYAKLKILATVRDSQKNPLTFLSSATSPVIIIERNVDINNESEFDASTGMLRRTGLWK